MAPDSESLKSRTLLKLRNLDRSFGGLMAVRNVNLVVEEGRISALIGPNGAGKTTVFNVITHIFPPTSGEVLFRLENGQEVSVTGWRTDEICRAGIARTFQNIRLFRELPVLENVKLGLHRHTKGGLLGALFRPPPIRGEEREASRASWRYLEFVGLAHRAHEAASSLSYGEQRRLEIARALATQPRLLLLDEPAAGMNSQESENLMDLIRKIRAAGVTVLLIEHDMRLVMRISDYVYVLDHGVLISQGPPATVQQDPKVIEAYLGIQE